MGDTMQQDGVKSRVAEDDLEHTLSGRIFPENSFDLLTYRPEHLFCWLSVQNNYLVDSQACFRDSADRRYNSVSCTRLFEGARQYQTRFWPIPPGQSFTGCRECPLWPF